MSKSALIVDDSKSARMVLKRVLETHSLNVSMAESANEALDYLTRHRPDVIFMDHMMPGMNGFEAVAAIKKNPHTATIPIMMYTSKKGEVYVGQARALGAVGVLPKGVAPVEVSKVLRALRLVEVEQRDVAEKRVAAAGGASGGAGVVPKPQEQPRVQPAPQPKVPVPALDRELRVLLKDLFEQQQKFLHKELRDGFEVVAGRLVDEIRELPVPAPEIPPKAEARFPAGFSRIAAVVLAGTSLALGGLYWQSHQSMHDLLARNNELQTALEANAKAVAEAPRSATETRVASRLDSSGADPEVDKIRESLRNIYSAALDDLEVIANQSSAYRFGELPLGDERTRMLEQLSDRLMSMEYVGVVRLEVHVADYCLKISDSGGYLPAENDLPVSKCDRLGLSTEEAYEQGLGQSIAFANFIQLAEDQSGGRIRYEIVSLGNTEPLLQYPLTSSSTSAGAWNQVADANNRVVVSLLPDSI